jgi:outer membrane protein
MMRSLRADVRRITLLFTLLLVGTAISAQSLDQVIDNALAENLQIDNAAIDAELARLNLENARAARLPRVTFQGSSSYLFNPPEGITVPEGALGSTDVPGNAFPVPVPDSPITLVPDAENTYFQLKASLSQPIWTWGKLDAAEQIAEIQLEQARLRDESTRGEIIRDLRSAWATYKMLSASLPLADRMEGIYRDILSDREFQFDQGLINFQSVLEARYRLATMSRSAAEIRESLNTVGRSIAISAGLDPANLVPSFEATELETLLSAPEPGYSSGLLIDQDEESAMLTEAFEQNRDLRDLKLSAQVARLNEEIALASRNFRPDIGLSMEIEVAGQRIPLSYNWRESWDTSATLSIGLSFDALDWGVAENELAAAAGQASQAANGLELLQNGQEITLRNLVQRHNLAIGSAYESSLNQRYLAEQYKNAQVSFDNDLLTREELLGSEILLLGARLETLARLMEYETVLAELDFLLGR